MQDLDGDRSLELGVERAIHRAEAALPENRLDRVTLREQVTYARQGSLGADSGVRGRLFAAHVLRDHRCRIVTPRTSRLFDGELAGLLMLVTVADRIRARVDVREERDLVTLVGVEADRALHVLALRLAGDLEARGCVALVLELQLNFSAERYRRFAWRPTFLVRDDKRQLRDRPV